MCSLAWVFLIKISYYYCGKKVSNSFSHHDCYLVMNQWLFCYFCVCSCFQWNNLWPLRLSWSSCKNFHKAVLKAWLFISSHQVTFTGQCLLTQRLPLKPERFPLIAVSLSAILMQSIQSAKKDLVSSALCITITSLVVSLACTMVKYM